MTEQEKMITEDLLENEELRKLGTRFNFLDRHRRRFLIEYLGDTGLVSHQFNFMMTLHHNPGISQEVLSEMINIDKTRIARSATQLEEEGYITRVRNAGNRRRYSLYLTEKGEAMVPRIRKANAAWAAVLTRGIEPEKIHELTDLLGVMLENIK